VSVTVFVAANCPHCAALLDDLTRRHVAFDLVDLTTHPERLVELAAVTWERRLPAIVDHERCSVGFAGRSSSWSELGLSLPARRPG
jgi:glutaredoxin